MALSDQITAIYSDQAITADQKRYTVHKLKADSHASALAAVVGKAYSYNGITWTLLFAASVILNGCPMLHLVISAVRQSDGVVLLAAADKYFVNPPVKSAALVDDLATAAKEMLARLV